MARTTGTTIVRAAVLLMALEGVEQVTGLVKQMVIAARFGTSAQMDAYVVATTIAGLVILWVTLPTNQVLIPMFRHDLARAGESRAWANVSVVFNNLAVLLIVIAVGAGLVAPHLVTLLAPGFEPDAHALATSLARVVAVSVVFVGAARVLSQIYFSYRRFFTPGIAGTANNAVLVLAFLAMAPALGIQGLALAVVAGAVAELAIQLPILWAKRRLYTARVDPRSPQMAEMGRLSLPLLLSTGGTEVARITDRVFASLLPAGSLTALSFAQRLNGLQADFVLRPLMRSSYPHFAQLSAERDFTGLSRHLFQYLRVMFFVTVPIAVGLMALSEEVVRLLFQRGAFDETSVRLTSQALLVYTLGFPATALSRILDRTFFTLKDTKTPTRIALLRLGLKVGLAGLLVRPLAHVGIALAESLSQLARLPVLLRALPADIRRQEIGRTLWSFARTIAVGGAMAAAMHLTARWLDGVVALPLEVAIVGLAGAAVFAGLAYPVLGDETRTILQAAGARRRPPASPAPEEP
jgi:putative peptidoglycan lipid II flippase